MPRNVRNFWVVGTADGSATLHTFGAKSASDGISVRVKVRQGKGTINPTEYLLSGYCDDDGSLRLVLESMTDNQPTLLWSDTVGSR